MNKTAKQITESNQVIDGIIAKFPFNEVHRIITQLGLEWLHPETNNRFIPTIKELKEHATLLLDSVACYNTEKMLRTSYFAAHKTGKGIELLFIPYSVHS